MIKKRPLVRLINFTIGIVIVTNGIYFLTDEKGIVDGTDTGVFIVFIASLAALILCRFSLLKAISTQTNCFIRY